MFKIYICNLGFIDFVRLVFKIIFDILIFKSKVFEEVKVLRLRKC